MLSLHSTRNLLVEVWRDFCYVIAVLIRCSAVKAATKHWMLAGIWERVGCWLLQAGLVSTYMHEHVKEMTELVFRGVDGDFTLCQATKCTPPSSNPRGSQRQLLSADAASSSANHHILEYLTPEKHDQSSVDLFPCLQRK